MSAPRLTTTELQEDLTLLARADSSSNTSLGPVSWAIAAALLTSIACVWFWRRRAIPRHTPAPLESPAAVALREIGQWADLRENVDLRTAAIAVSAAVRVYMEAGFQIHSLTLTTEEFWNEQRARGVLPKEQEPFLTDFLSATDEIKYAGLAPSSDQFRLLTEAAIGFVRATRAPTA